MNYLSMNLNAISFVLYPSASYCFKIIRKGALFNLCASSDWSPGLTLYYSVSCRFPQICKKRTHWVHQVYFLFPSRQPPTKPCNSFKTNRRTSELKWFLFRHNKCASKLIAQRCFRKLFLTSHPLLYLHLSQVLWPRC